MKNLIEYPWYNIAKSEDGLSQGDFVFSCPILQPFHDTEKSIITANYSEYNVIIMSQSCDIINKKLENVLVCPFWSLSDIEAENPWFRSIRNKEKLRKGNQPNYHLLNKCTLNYFELDYLIVDFRDVFSVPLDYLMEYSEKHKKRLRLLSPYKEHLSQSFARFFMRVGLPVDIEPFR